MNAWVKEQGKQTEYFWQQEFVVEVQPEKVKSGAELQITSPDAPNFVAKVPLTLDVQNAIALSSSTAFFGEVAVGKTASASLALSSLAPFRVVSVTPDDTALQVQGDFGQTALQHTLRFTFTPSHAGRFYSGTLSIQTDVPGEEVVQVPFVARSP